MKKLKLIKIRLLRKEIKLEKIYLRFPKLKINIKNILTDIENSITFCSIGAMHPSIIKNEEL